MVIPKKDQIRKSLEEKLKRYLPYVATLNALVLLPEQVWRKALFTKSGKGAEIARFESRLEK